MGGRPAAPERGSPSAGKKPSAGGEDCHQLLRQPGPAAAEPEPVQESPSSQLPWPPWPCQLPDQDIAATRPRDVPAKTCGARGERLTVRRRTSFLRNILLRNIRLRSSTWPNESSSANGHVGKRCVRMSRHRRHECYRNRQERPECTHTDKLRFAVPYAKALVICSGFGLPAWGNK